MSPLREERCRPPGGADYRLDASQIQLLLEQLEGWQIDAECLFKEFRFADFSGAMLFVNAVACLAERENHHPALDIDYRRVVVSYRTHDVGGLSRNDFICAAKIEALITI